MVLVQFRFGLGSALVLFWFGSGSVQSDQVLLRFGSDLVLIRFSFGSGSIKLFQARFWFCSGSVQDRVFGSGSV